MVAVVLLAAAGVAGAVDVPVTGRSLSGGDNKDIFGPDKGRFAFVSVDAAIAPPFDDPTTGASLLVFNSNADCGRSLELLPQYWTPIRGDGAAFGWRYKEPQGGGGTIKLSVQRTATGGKIVLKAKRTRDPCRWSDPKDPLPLHVTLTTGGTRYCAAFDVDSVRVNEPGRFKAKNAPAPTTCISDDDFTATTLNLLHGITCPGPTARCRLEERVQLTGEWIVARSCPDVVAFQEVFDFGPGSSSAELMMEHLTDVCPFPYEVAYIKDNGVDDSLILSRYRVVSLEFEELLNGFRNVLHAVIDHPIGFVDVFSTHLAAGVDGGNNACGTGDPCPPECLGLTAPTVRDCQAEQVARFVESEDAPFLARSPAFILGDFNQVPGSQVYDVFANRGWLDAYLGGGNPECVPATGVGCSSGREDADLSDLESPVPNVTSRIDYAFIRPAYDGGGGDIPCEVATLDTGTDADGDGVATRHFADEPNTFGPACGPAPAPICWPSDHNGVQLDLNCE